jgi:hypothetical protein
MTFRQTIRKLLEVPGPQALGMAASDALGSRKLTPFQEGPTWEDWNERVKREYPVRYLLSEVVGRWLSLQACFMRRRLGRFKSRWITRDHMLDLRGVETLWLYEYNRLHPSTIMWLASWKALKLYIEQVKPTDPALKDFPEAVKAEPWYVKDKAVYDEAQALYRYWMVERKAEHDADNRMHDAVEKAGLARDREGYEVLSKKWLEHYRATEERELAMFRRLTALYPFF